MQFSRRLLFLFVVLAIAGCQTTSQGTEPDFQPFSVNEINDTAQNITPPEFNDGAELEIRKPKALTLAELHQKYPTYFITNGSRDLPKVALTFDDAPDDQFTPMVLDALKEHQVKATFFIVGNRAEKYPHIIRRIIDEGHEMGNHSYNHSNLPKLTDPLFQAQVNRTQTILQAQVGKEPAFLRPPYGNIGEDQIKWLASQKMYVINWDVDSLDWKNLSAEEVTTNIMANVNRGSIILQHSGGGTGEDLTGTVEAIPQILQYLKEHDIEPVLVSELLNIPAYK